MAVPATRELPILTDAVVPNANKIVFPNLFEFGEHLIKKMVAEWSK